MYIYICIYVYIYMYIYMYLCMYVCMYVWMKMHIWARVHMYPPSLPSNYLGGSRGHRHTKQEWGVLTQLAVRLKGRTGSNMYVRLHGDCEQIPELSFAAESKHHCRPTTKKMSVGPTHIDGKSSQKRYWCIHYDSCALTCLQYISMHQAEQL
jgi:hypothetical protein